MYGERDISYWGHDLWSICWKTMEISSNCYLRWEFVSHMNPAKYISSFHTQSLRVQTHTHLQQWQKSHWLHWERDRTQSLKVLHHNNNHFFQRSYELERWALLFGFWLVAWGSLKINLGVKMKLRFLDSIGDLDLNNLVSMPSAQHQSLGVTLWAHTDI